MTYTGRELVTALTHFPFDTYGGDTLTSRGMSKLTMSDPENEERQRPSQQVPEQSRNTRMPFDTSELDRIPQTTEDDPPYRNWWVGEER